MYRKLNGVNIVYPTREKTAKDFCEKFSFGDSSETLNRINESFKTLSDVVCYGDIERIGKIAGHIKYLTKKVDTLKEHNDMINDAKLAILSLKSGQYTTRWHVRQLFKENYGRKNYQKFAYGATIVALEQLVEDGTLQIVRDVDNEVIYKRV